MAKDNKTPTPLSVMTGEGGPFIVKGESYKIKPIALKDIDKFMSDNLSVGSQLFNITDKNAKAKVDNWLSNYCFDEKNKAINLETAMELGWDVVDLKEFFRKLCDFSG